MLNVYYKPLRESQFRLQPLLQEEDIDIIFGESDLTVEGNLTKYVQIALRKDVLF